MTADVEGHAREIWSALRTGGRQLPRLTEAGRSVASLLGRQPAIAIPATVTLSDLVPLIPLGEAGEGGEAVVYRTGYRGLLLKQYRRPDSINPNGLATAVRWRLRLSAADRLLIDRATAWPLASGVDIGGRVVGSLMFPAPPEFSFSRAIDGVDALLELQHLAEPSFANVLATPIPTTRTRIQIAYNLASVVALFDSHGVVHGDFSFRNLLYSVSGNIFLLDCDGVRIGGGPVVSSRPATPEWLEPNRPPTGPDTAGQQWQLALAIARIIGRCRFDPIRGRYRLILPNDLPMPKRALGQLIMAGLGPKLGRPGAADWRSELVAYL